jgi:lysosomal acid lipase/cholesteryl ester hydrolase
VTNRGSEYSPNEGKLGEFSFHEIGFYDLPVAFEYIYNITK